jgi:hypothetical protein
MRSTLNGLNGTISLGSKNNIFNIVVASIHQTVSIPSLLQLIRFTKPLNCSLVYFFSRSQYNVCKFTQRNVFTTHTKSHTNVSWLWTNLIRLWTTSNMGIMSWSPGQPQHHTKFQKWVKMQLQSPQGHHSFLPPGICTP